MAEADSDSRRRERPRVSYDYSAKELDALAKLSPEQLSKLHGERLAFIRKIWWVFPDWAMVVGFFVAGALLFYYHGTAARVACLLIALYCATQFAYRAGVYYGFTRGFEDGHEAGVRRALGITEEDAKEIHDILIEARIDELSGSDKQQPNTP